MYFLAVISALSFVCVGALLILRIACYKTKFNGFFVGQEKWRETPSPMVPQWFRR